MVRELPGQTNRQQARPTRPYTLSSWNIQRVALGDRPWQLRTYASLSGGWPCNVRTAKQNTDHDHERSSHQMCNYTEVMRRAKQLIRALSRQNGVPWPETTWDRHGCTPATVPPTNGAKVSGGGKRPKRTLEVALLSMDRMLRHTDVTVSAGLQPSYKTFKQTERAQASSTTGNGGQERVTCKKQRTQKKHRRSVGHSPGTQEGRSPRRTQSSTRWKTPSQQEHREGIGRFQRTVSVRVHVRVPRRWVHKDHLWGLDGVLRSTHVDEDNGTAREDKQ